MEETKVSHIITPKSVISVPKFDEANLTAVKDLD
jgi:hypothetical protein